MRHAAAIFFFLCVLHCFGQNEIDLYNKANAQFQYQNYDEAIVLLTKVILAKPDYADAYALRGDCYYYLKEYQTGSITISGMEH